MTRRAKLWAGLPSSPRQGVARAVFALWMITIAQYPPDAEHPLGHAKADYFSAGFEGILIFGAAGAIIWSAVMRLLEPQPLEALGFGLALSVGSSVINLLVALALRRASRRLRSIALEGSSRHLMTLYAQGDAVYAGSASSTVKKLVTSAEAVRAIACETEIVDVSADGNEMPHKDFCQVLSGVRVTGRQ